MSNERTDGELTRIACERSFKAACKRSTRDGIPMTAATLTGLVLAFCGDAAAAIEAVKNMPPGPLWSDVQNNLETIARDERADTVRPQAAAGGTGR